MSREQLVQLARRTIAHARAGTVPQADAVMSVPASNYFDQDRWRLEMDRVFKRVPLTLGFSCEVRSPGDYRALEVAGVPVLITRDSENQLRLFVNSCSHRGAQIVEAGAGNARRFTCPYHAWSYDSGGALVGILDRDEFGEIDLSCNGLAELPCEERAGLVFGCLTPGAELNLDEYFCGYDSMLETLGLAECQVVGRQSVEGPNWKVAYDGYLDFYHLPILHKDTFGPDYSNKAIYDAWGPHQRVTSPDHRILDWADSPEDDWTMRRINSGIWTIFPHISIARFDVDGGPIFMVSQLFPGDSPDTSMTTQHFLATFEPTEEQQQSIEKQMDFLLGVVRDEDYYTGKRIQTALKTGAKSHVLFGRNEAGGQRFHTFVDQLVNAEDDAAYASLLAKSEAIFQP